jgi:hypothetical protein
MVRIKYKSESWLMRFLSFILFFSKGFMTNYATTIGKTIYLPDKSKTWNPNVTKALLAHEYVHVFDYDKDKLFSIKYLFPQILVLFALLVTPFTLFGLLFLCFILPFPAYWRKKYEVRGYTMTLIAWNDIWKRQGKSDDYIAILLDRMVIRLNKHFTKSSYYWMWPFGVEKELRKSIHTIRTGDIFTGDDTYQKVKDVVLVD